MRLRGLTTERRDVGLERADMRRELCVQSVFSRQLSSGVSTDARPFWALMVYAHSGAQATVADAGARSAAASARLSSAPKAL